MRMFKYRFFLKRKSSWLLYKTVVSSHMGLVKGHTPARLSARGLMTACDPHKAGAPKPALGLPPELESLVAEKGAGGLHPSSLPGKGHR